MPETVVVREDVVSTVVVREAVTEIVQVAAVGPQGPAGAGGGGGSSTLAGLTDVLIASPATAQVLRYAGTRWENAALQASDIASGTLADARISLSSVTQHQSSLSIGWSQLTGVPSTFPPSAHTHVAASITDFATAADARIAAASVNALADVTIASPSTGQVLRWNGSAWVNAQLAYSELGGVPSTFAPSSHAASHRHGGSDEVATATPAANAIPKANGSGKLNSWVDATVSSVGLTIAPGAAAGLLTVSGSPVTSSGSITVDLQNVGSSHALLGPIGSSGKPTFRGIEIVDLPQPLVRSLPQLSVFDRDRLIEAFAVTPFTDLVGTTYDGGPWLREPRCVVRFSLYLDPKGTIGDGELAVRFYSDGLIVSGSMAIVNGQGPNQLLTAIDTNSNSLGPLLVPGMSDRRHLEIEVSLFALVETNSFWLEFENNSANGLNIRQGSSVTVTAVNN